jgi:hypothetical protein
MGAGRLWASAIRLKDGRVLIVGGSNPYGPSYAGTDAAIETYDPASGRFTPAGSYSGGSLGSLALLPDGRVLGLARSDTTGHVSIEIYDPATAAVTSPAGLDGYYDATALQDGRVLFVGGIPIPQGVGGAVPETLVAELYDSATGSLTATGTPGIDFQAYTTTLLADGRVLLVGFTGRADEGPTPAAVIYDPVGQTFDSVSEPQPVYPSVTVAHTERQETATLLLDGRVLFAGGGSIGGRTPAFKTAVVFE